MRRYNSNYDGYGGVNYYPPAKMTDEEITNLIKEKPPMPLPDRIDFTVLSDDRIIVLKLRRDTTTDPARPLDIPLPDGHSINPSGFDLESAIAWCQDHGYTVRRWHNGARAWLNGVRVIRTRGQIQRKRAQNPCAVNMDFAYDG